MDFVRYAAGAAALVSAHLETPEDLQDLVRGRVSLLRRLSARDGQSLRRFQRDLRPVFACASSGDEAGAVKALNTLLDRHPISTRLAPEERGTWQLRVSDTNTSVAEHLIGEALLGLAMLACDAGLERLGTCAAIGCDTAFVDTSPNHSRRYCSERCSSRANVAAYRARARAGTAAGPGKGEA